MRRFPDEQSAIKYLKPILWPTIPVCPYKSKHITEKHVKDQYHCNDYRKDFIIRVGTILHRLHVPFHKWLYAMYLLVSARKGISSLQFSEGIRVTQKSV